MAISALVGLRGRSLINAAMFFAACSMPDRDWESLAMGYTTSLVEVGPCRWLQHRQGPLLMSRGGAAHQAIEGARVRVEGARRVGAAAL